MASKDPEDEADDPFAFGSDGGEDIYSGGEASDYEFPVAGEGEWEGEPDANPDAVVSIAECSQHSDGEDAMQEFKSIGTTMVTSSGKHKYRVLKVDEMDTWLQLVCRPAYFALR